MVYYAQVQLDWGHAGAGGTWYQIWLFNRPIVRKIWIVINSIPGNYIGAVGENHGQYGNVIQYCILWNICYHLLGFRHCNPNTTFPKELSRCYKIYSMFILNITMLIADCTVCSLAKRIMQQEFKVIKLHCIHMK